MIFTETACVAFPYIECKMLVGSFNLNVYTNFEQYCNTMWRMCRHSFELITINNHILNTKKHNL